MERDVLRVNCATGVDGRRRVLYVGYAGAFWAILF